MTAALAHRGPDGEGLWVDPAASLALGHRRLSVYDLSEAGAQPMRSANGARVLTYNGAIYNFVALRAALPDHGAGLKSQSDTEVLLALIDRNGVAATLPRLNGMFAFAVWDAEAHRLTLARDAFGKKPLLYRVADGEVRFASELGAFLVDAERPVLDADAAQLMLAFGVVPEPFTMLKGVRKLPPGHMLEVWRGADGAFEHRLTRWFEPEGVSAPSDPLETFETIFADAVSARLAADVPVGAFLSGGVDSSLVATFAQRLLPQPLKTFTVAFDVEGYDESAYAAAVAEHLGTDHHVLRLSAANVEHSLLSAAGWFDEPFGDPSAIPTRAVAAFARDSVTVALTGDGGDETFLGYTLHRRNAGMVTALEMLPLGLRRKLAAGIEAVGGRRGDWYARALRQSDARGFYLSQRMGGFRPKDGMLREIAERAPPLSGRASNAEWLGRCDMAIYLVDDMLAKVDRAAMSVGLEARNPFLDRGVVAFAQGLPLVEKIAGQGGKRLLRRALARSLPAGLFERPKAGFRTPIGRWLNAPRLRDWSRMQAEAFDERFGWRTEGGLNGRELWGANGSDPDRQGEYLWLVCQLADWSALNGV